MLINITGAEDLTLFELDEAANRIREEVDADANIIVGSTLDATMEGGMRVPMIARWPKKIPAGSICKELSTTMDFLPTFCALAGATLPTAKIDGHDIRPLLFAEEGAETPYEVFYYYRRRQLQAVRMGNWKYHLPLDKTHPRWTSPEPEGKGRPGKLVLLATDLKEENDITDLHPEIIEKLVPLIEAAEEELGNNANEGSGQRNAKTLDSSKPMTLSKD